jgi:SAM-dependent methyltransferase
VRVGWDVVPALFLSQSAKGQCRWTPLHNGERCRQAALAVSDFFSTQAADYARFRPRYPAELFAYFADATSDHSLAWDCATGSGQMAVPLAEYFTHVIATDLSAAQIEHAEHHPRVEYRLAPAEASGLLPASVNLITVAQALHWLDLDAFYGEARRVLASDGAIAVSSYGSALLDDPELSRRLDSFEWKTLGAYWPPRRKIVGEALRSLPFPFREAHPPEFQLEARWTLMELLGYARSWSATARYFALHHQDPIPELDAALRPGWGPPEHTRLVRWPFVVRLGYA